VPGTEKNQVDYKLDRIELYNKEMDLFIPIFSCTVQPSGCLDGVLGTSSTNASAGQRRASQSTTG
jgi:hypothetical protein